jgi:hypothetical protein
MTISADRLRGRVWDDARSTPALAREIGMDRKVFRRWLHRQAALTDAQLARLAEVLGVTLEPDPGPDIPEG